MNGLRIGVLGFAALVTYVLLSSIQQRNRLRARGQRALATVTDQQTTTNAEGRLMYRFQVQFTARNGRRYTELTDWRRFPLPQEVGELVALRYEEATPSAFKLEEDLTQTKDYVLLALTWAGAAYLLWITR